MQLTGQNIKNIWQSCIVANSKLSDSSMLAEALVISVINANI